jgi:hypothetical protein
MSFPAADARPALPSKATKPCQGDPGRVLEKLGLKIA